MATSEAAMGKIRMAEKAGGTIPRDLGGAPQTAPHNRPEAGDRRACCCRPAGPKGFGLVLLIDLMCGLLSQGAFGAQVRPLYGDFAAPYDCSHLFIAIDVAHFCDAAGSASRPPPPPSASVTGKRAPGVEALFTARRAGMAPARARRRSTTARLRRRRHVDADCQRARRRGETPFQKTMKEIGHA